MTSEMCASILVSQVSALIPAQAAQQDALIANNEAARLERDLAQARTAAIANGMGVKSRLQTLQLRLGPCPPLQLILIYKYRFTAIVNKLRRLPDSKKKLSALL